MPDKLPSLQNIDLPGNDDVFILNKGIGRPQVSIIEKKEEASGTKEAKQFFALNNPLPQYSHIWVYAFNDGAYYATYRPYERPIYIAGRKDYATWSNSQSKEGYVLPYPPNFKNNMTVDCFDEQGIDLHCIPIDQINSIEIKLADLNPIKFKEPCVKENNQTARFVISERSYKDEFTIFAFAYGDEKNIKTLPSTITCQNTKRPLYISPNSFFDITSSNKDGLYDYRSYIWTPDGNGYFLLPFFLKQDYIHDNLVNNYLKIDAEEDEISYAFDCYSLHYKGFDNSLNSLNKNNTLDTTNLTGLFLKRPKDDLSYNRFSGLRCDILNSAFSRVEKGWIWDETVIDLNKPYLKTNLNVFKGLSPELDVSDMVINKKEFKFPQNAFWVSNHHNANLSSVVIDFQGVKDEFNENFFDKKFTFYNFLIDSPLECDCLPLKQPFKPLHPTTNMQIYYRSFYRPVEEINHVGTVAVIYNNPPRMTQGPLMIDNLKSAQATDDDCDRILAYEILLLDDTLVGKVDLCLDEKNYVIKAGGLCYSAKDSLSGPYLKMVDQYLDSDFIPVKIRPCDQYAWGDYKTYHILVK